MLAISYHNLGIEEDHCGNYENSKNAFAKAYEIIQKENGPDDPISKKFYAVYAESKIVRICHFDQLFMAFLC